MTTYVYKAKKNTAETVSGQIKAKTEDEAIDLINQLGLLPISIEQQQMEIDLGTPRKIRSKELYLFSRQLSNLLKSGVSLLRALAIIEEQTSNKYFQKVIYHIGANIKNGQSFSDSLESFSHIFSTLYVTMIRAGEESGRLQEMLLNIATYQKKQARIMQKVRNALTYPCIMATLGVGTVYFMLTFVLPRMTKLFVNIGSELPLPTKILLAISGFFSKTWLGVIVCVALSILFIKKWRETERGKFLLARLALSVPIFKDVIIKTELARFCSTFEMLLKSGINAIRALQISIPVLKNEIIKEGLSKCRDSLIQGGSLGVSIKKNKDLPAMMGHLISVGEESGNLEEVLQEIADTYEQETAEQVKLMTTLLEPIMILAIGLVVGLIVFAMLLPIFEIDVLAR